MSLYADLRAHAGHDGRIKLGIMGELDGKATFHCDKCNVSLVVADAEPGDRPIKAGALPPGAVALSMDTIVIVNALSELGHTLDLILRNQGRTHLRRDKGNDRDTRAAILTRLP